MNLLGKELKATNGSTAAYTVSKELGRGSQGIVYEVQSLNNKSLALKAYPRAYLDRDSDLESRLQELVYIGSPHPSFLWPIEFLELNDGNETIKGYTMPIREKRYVSSTSLMSGGLEVDFRSLLTACKNLADAFYHLHAHGLCYKDLSFGNFFFDPSNGDCIICDIDNICYSGQGGGVLGTPGFMAPEIVTGEARPSALSDLHSLSVLIFYMLYIHHPLEGMTETSIRIMDDIARRRIYGTDALYIFNQQDRRNSPHPELHANAMFMDSILPRRLKQAFEKAFVVGLQDPNMRVVESEWQLVLGEVLDTLGHCSLCGQEVFLDGFSPGTSYQCWACGQDQYPIILSIGTTKSLASPGLKVKDIYNKHLGEIIRHPKENKLIALKNETDLQWTAKKPNGQTSYVPPGRSIVLGPGVEIEASGCKIEVAQG